MSDGMAFIEGPKGIRGMRFGEFRREPKPEPTPEQIARKELEEKVYGIYMDGLGDDAGFYAREVEESGLISVYLAGVEQGKQDIVLFGEELKVLPEEGKTVEEIFGTLKPEQRSLVYYLVGHRYWRVSK